MKTALITGGSRGIGFDIARVMAREHYNLILVSRNLSRLERVRDELSRSFRVKIRIIGQDLSEKDASLKVFEQVMNYGIQVDVLVNNAGIGDFGMFSREDPARISRMVNLNILALTELTRLFLPGMIERREGKVLNVSSLAAFLPGPYMAVYYASKAYVKSFSEAINSELKGTGVMITAVCPGLTKTGFQQEVGSEKSNASRLGMMATSASVAEAAYKALMEGKEIVVPGIINLSIAKASGIIPTRFKTRVIRKMQELNRKIMP
ncbi:MAG TPA: SDR family oxidoreductase [Bacteroidales bacterium]|nr:SDR family oxidoreductase [Bacteroidales bacterium]